MMVLSSNETWVCTGTVIGELKKKYEQLMTKEKVDLADIERTYADQRKAG